MAEFFKTSQVWIVDYRYEGRARRWYKAFAPGVDVVVVVDSLLHELYGGRARRVGVRSATDDEERQFLHGQEPRNVYCPTGRGGLSEPDRDKR